MFLSVTSNLSAKELFVSDAISRKCSLARKKPLEGRSNILTYSYYALLLSRTTRHAADRLFYSASSTESNLLSEDTHFCIVIHLDFCPDVIWYRLSEQIG
jgi:hypothetical protein